MKTVELRRHTANDGDTLTPDGIRAAVEIGQLLADRYDLLISSGAQRATQTLACFLAGSGRRYPAGVTIDQAFRSSVEDRWFAVAKASGGGGLEAFLRADRALVDAESAHFGGALRRVFDSLPKDGRAIIVGHSPMHEVAVYGLTRQVIAPISKGAGVLVGQDGGQFRLVAGPSISLGEAIPSARSAPLR
jgi:broad specificity phosphatase PhoE